MPPLTPPVIWSPDNEAARVALCSSAAYAFLSLYHTDTGDNKLFRTIAVVTRKAIARFRSFIAAP